MGQMKIVTDMWHVNCQKALTGEVVQRKNYIDCVEKEWNEE